jgi:hypothetical protein
VLFTLLELCDDDTVVWDDGGGDCCCCFVTATADEEREIEEAESENTNQSPLFRVLGAAALLLLLLLLLVLLLLFGGERPCRCFHRDLLFSFLWELAANKKAEEPGDRYRKDVGVVSSSSFSLSFSTIRPASVRNKDNDYLSNLVLVGDMVTISIPSLSLQKKDWGMETTEARRMAIGTGVVLGDTACSFCVLFTGSSWWSCSGAPCASLVWKFSSGVFFDLSPLWSGGAAASLVGSAAATGSLAGSVAAGVVSASGEQEELSILHVWLIRTTFGGVATVLESSSAVVCHGFLKRFSDTQPRAFGLFATGGWSFDHGAIFLLLVGGTCRSLDMIFFVVTLYHIGVCFMVALCGSRILIIMVYFPV